MNGVEKRRGKWMMMWRWRANSDFREKYHENIFVKISDAYLRYLTVLCSQFSPYSSIPSGIYL
jgi:hypothetical protein